MDKTAILDAESFARILGVERKRTDRSQRPFLLVLVEFGQRVGMQSRQWQHLTQRVMERLQRCIRQTDIMGWYQHHTVLGIICTELQDPDCATVRIREKVQSVLQAQLTPQQCAAITISTYIYPPQVPSSPALPDHDKLYVDLKQRKLGLFVKRVVDIFGSAFLLMLFSPVFLLIAAAIKLTSRGPVLFKQTRIGQFGKPFTFLKFRSMYTNADPAIHAEYIQQFIQQGKNGANPNAVQQNGLFKLQHDPRIMPLGHILRRSSLDELPQLLHVLGGTMSLVGPRPPILYELQLYDAWHVRRVLEAKPGLTGLWQVHGRSRTVFDDMVRLDLQYIDKQSLWMDLKLLFQTPWAVLRCTGAR